MGTQEVSQSLHSVSYSMRQHPETTSPNLLRFSELVMLLVVLENSAVSMSTYLKGKN